MARAGFLALAFMTISVGRAGELRQAFSGQPECRQRIDEVLRTDRKFTQDQFEYSSHQINGEKVVVAIGSVGPREAERMRQALTRFAPVDEVWLHSPGGVATQGPEIGRVLRNANVVTRIPKGFVCFSACTYAFLGGVIREVDQGGCYGVHMFSRYTGDGEGFAVKQIMDLLKATRDRTTEDATKMIASTLRTIEARSARLARDQAKFLQEMSVSQSLLLPVFDTDAVDGHFLTRDELIRYFVVNAPQRRN